MDLNIETGTNFKKDVSFEHIIYNIKRRAYKIIGMGSGRIVFDLMNGYVVKVAKNRRGIAQNEAEYKISINDNSNLFAKILCTSEKFDLLLMEKADRIRSISYIWNYFNVRNNLELYNVHMFQDISDKYDLALEDFGRAANWGKINGKPVIIDYGFTKQIQRKFYMRARLRI